jgi:thiamine biosynthesis lipoprotein
LNFKLVLSSLTFILALFLIFKKEDVAEIQIYKGNIMGTSYNIILQSDVSGEYAHFKAYNILQKVNQEMSTYIDDSLISKVNKADIGKWVKVSQDFLDVLSFATALCKDTRGIYDVSIGKLVNLWGFGPASVDSEPSAEELSYFSSQVGCNSIELDHLNLSIKKVKDVELDFSSIAKGFGVDKVYEFLIKQSYLNGFFIEIGGEIRSTSLKSNDQPWKAGIINPIQQEKLIYTFLSSDFDSFALATSGDYRNIRIFNERELSHTLDTLSGIPANLAKKSVSVVAENAMKADALATTLNAMTIEQAINYANQKQIKALFITESEGQSKLIFSEKLKQVKM